MNDLGAIVGVDGPTGAYRWRNGRFVPLQLLVAGGYIGIHDVNNRGVSVGMSVGSSGAVGR
jgi:hypothetical protein